MYFYDAPFYRLEDYYEELEYSVKFVTCFQYSIGQDFVDDFLPILSFSWSLTCKVEKDEEKGWIIREQSHTSAEELKASIKKYDSNDKFIDTSALRHLYRGVKVSKTDSRAL